jgi:phosphatidylglycerol:prolipoprotein diacylglycerol transferase
MVFAGVVASVFLWCRLVRRDPTLLFIYLAGLAGAFVGAKLVYFGAEGWLHWNDANRWMHLATGKSILGGLLGGYASVESAKRLVGYTRATGDWFAIIAPIGIIFGRIGCIAHGCCLGAPCESAWFTVKDAAGVARWPAAYVELGFNAMILGTVLLLRRKVLWPGQHFHIYLIAYGAFRFAHEFLRATPAVVGPITGYQIAAAAVIALGITGLVIRHWRQNSKGIRGVGPALSSNRAAATTSAF